LRDHRKLDLNWKLTKLSKILKQSSESLDSNAAVVLLLRPINQDFQVLFVKRAKNPTDTWSGQIALPGGKREPEDIDIKMTIVRETLEETNLDLLNGTIFLGTMEPMRSIEKSELTVVPFVVLQEKEQTIKLNTELIEYFWASLRELEFNEGTTKLRLSNFPAYKIGKHIIWGLTYNILRNLLSLLSDIEKENQRDK
jgi:8-oxo-dGTP pyrophosphatase MutT (NUDIX family)